MTRHPDAPTATAAACRLESLQWRNEAAVATLLAHAFVDDPLVVAMCGSPNAERLRRMQWAFRVAVRAHCLARQPAWVASTAATATGGIVLVSDSGPPAPVAGDLLFTARAMLHAGWRIAVRGIRAAAVIAAHTPAEPFTYLRTLGVEPREQRTGIGTALVRQVIATSRPDVPIYLETAKEANIAFYERQGFQRTGEFRCLGIPLWSLLRPSTPPGDTPTRSAPRRSVAVERRRMQ